ncbi:histidine biosynthesis trifunctional-protein [Calocera viscosa TUFC12733]|uniref:Histidine biosynthesis trifunctional protein n=1 Tax=Calocera viscosa (strain TUFC12733) TaxID=1330018 RepID=A0A167JM36_CALVF|nr:histidine biosynthesis trifunctional-protein [Calocera viscosa TUFC12733]
MAPPIILPYVDTHEPEVLAAAARLGQLLVPPSFDLSLLPPSCGYTILASSSFSTPSVDQVTAWLDGGADRVVLPSPAFDEAAAVLPAGRLVQSFILGQETHKDYAALVLLRTREPLPAQAIKAFQQDFAGEVLLWDESRPASVEAIRTAAPLGVPIVIPLSQLTTGSTTSQKLNIAEAFLAPVISDRPDGLIPTVVSAHPQGGRTLGMVYSSRDSVREALLTGKGVYFSRKHGLWRKGETSGATQDVVRIVADCDADCLEFQVVQHGAGFCHLNTPSCFGTLSGIAALEGTLKQRYLSAPEGSYTARLFNDPQLLRSKIMEEADELCTAEKPEDIAFEAADLIYFALAKCVSKGVSVRDIERSLDRKAHKVTRRKGDAKSKWVQANGAAESSKAAAAANGSAAPTKPGAPEPKDTPIQMRSYDLASVPPSERAAMLKRPTLKSEEMIAKVKPIVDQVRLRGDAALRELTAKFDKAQLEEVIIRPPFTQESMRLPEEVKAAIDVAYRNVYAFHAAQADKAPLEVETMPGVVCSRFARPIATVGLYVPGGTAVLPSTALMLGIPAQVAGCKEIVLATPPRADGSIGPEVMYVASLVGATCILKAGGGQAVAAMAYGTETVPKVDKIFGPGNQWVTAAKMLVQNDTEALVAIDMPAGPSEVLVIADHTADAEFVAADLLSQAEHGVDSQVVLVAVDLTPEHLQNIEQAVDRQARALPRVEIMKVSVSKSLIVTVKTVREALDFSNEYAPEHLILHLEDAPGAVQFVQNAGSVFVGAYSPESCGDYASGTNHTLPTNGFARQFSGVNTLSFQKHITSQQVTKAGLGKLGPVVITLAECEGLDAHANAVKVRLAALARE